jgi:hypothetical protein
MFGKPELASPKMLAQNALDKRDWVAARIEEARRSGSRQEARQWAAELRKWEKLIAQYGLEHHAHRT